MAKVNTARDRAEEVFGSLQKKARELLEAEEGLAQTARELMDKNGLSPQEVRKTLEELVGRLKANKVWERVMASGAVVALSDYREEFERRAESSVQRVLGTLQIATKADTDALSKQVKALSRKLGELSKKLKKDDA